MKCSFGDNDNNPDAEDDDGYDVDGGVCNDVYVYNDNVKYLPRTVLNVNDSGLLLSMNTSMCELMLHVFPYRRQIRCSVPLCSSFPFVLQPNCRLNTRARIQISKKEKRNKTITHDHHKQFPNKNE